MPMWTEYGEALPPRGGSYQSFFQSGSELHVTSATNQTSSSNSTGSTSTSSFQGTFGFSVGFTQQIESVVVVGQLTSRRTMETRTDSLQDERTTNTPTVSRATSYGLTETGVVAGQTAFWTSRGSAGMTTFSSESSSFNNQTSETQRINGTNFTFTNTNTTNTTVSTSNSFTLNLTYDSIVESSATETTTQLSWTDTTIEFEVVSTDSETSEVSGSTVTSYFTTTTTQSGDIHDPVFITVTLTKDTLSYIEATSGVLASAINTKVAAFSCEVLATVEWCNISDTVTYTTESLTSTTFSNSRWEPSTTSTEGTTSTTYATISYTQSRWDWTTTTATRNNNPECTDYNNVVGGVVWVSDTPSSVEVNTTTYVSSSGQTIQTTGGFISDTQQSSASSQRIATVSFTFTEEQECSSYYLFFPCLHPSFTEFP